MMPLVKAKPLASADLRSIRNSFIQGPRDPERNAGLCSSSSLVSGAVACGGRSGNGRCFMRGGSIVSKLHRGGRCRRGTWPAAGDVRTNGTDRRKFLPAAISMTRLLGVVVRLLAARDVFFPGHSDIRAAEAADNRRRRRRYGLDGAARARAACFDCAQDDGDVALRWRCELTTSSRRATCGRRGRAPRARRRSRIGDRGRSWWSADCAGWPRAGSVLTSTSPTKAGTERGRPGRCRVASARRFRLQPDRAGICPDRG